MGLRPRFKTPFSAARDKLLGYALRPLMVFEPRTRFIIGSSALVTLTTLLLVNVSSGFGDNYKEGEVLNKVIVVPADITTIDVAETERRRQAAREETKAVFNFDSSRAEISVRSFLAAWEDLKKQEASRPSKLWIRGATAPGNGKAPYKFSDSDLDQL